MHIWRRGWVCSVGELGMHLWVFKLRAMNGLASTQSQSLSSMIILWTGHGAAPRVLLYFLICRSIPHIHKHVKQGLHELAESEAGNFRTAVLNLARTWHDVAAGTRTVHVPFPLRSRSSEIGLMAGDNNKAHYSLWLVPLPGLSRLGFFSAGMRWSRWSES